MMPSSLKVRELRTAEDLEAFCRGYHQSFRTKPVQYARPLTPGAMQGLTGIHGIEQDGAMRAGFILNSGAHRLRSLETLSLEAKARFHETYGGKCIWEITAVWKDPAYPSCGNIIWPWTAWYFLRSPATHILGTVYPNHPMARWYLCTHPDVLDAGAPDERLAVFVMTRRQYVETVVRNLSARTLRRVGAWRRQAQ